MFTVFVMLSVWLLLSLPLSVVLGAFLHHDTPPELIGMEGDLAVYLNSDGSFHRVSMIDHAAA